MARKSRKNAEVAAIVSTPEQVYYTAAAYVRLSSDDRRKKGDSIETQKSIIENFIAACPDIKLHDFYIDNGTTGTNFDRPAFQKMLSDLESGVINCVICKDLSRFGRNAIDAGFYIEKYFPSINARLVAVNDGFDSAHMGPSDSILLPLKNTINEAYALDISRKCRAVQQQYIREGKFVGRLAPYGYAKASDDCRRLVIDEDAATVVRQMFGWATRGANVREVVRRLNGSGVMPPSQYKAQKDQPTGSEPSRYWNYRTVLTILTDRVYVGDMLQGKTKKVNHKQLNVSPDEWVIVPNTHESIISLEQFDAVQQVLARLSAEDKAKRSPAKTSTPNLFKGKISCAHCGSAMHRKRQNSDGTYWFRCESQWKVAKDACVVVSVKEDDLLRQILILARKYYEVLCGKAVALWQNRAATSTKQAAAEMELASLRRELAKTGMFLKSLYECLVSGVIEKDEFKRMKSDYEAKISALEDRVSDLEQEREEFQRQNDARFDLFERLRDLRVSPDLTAGIIDALIEKILVYPDKSVEIIFKFQDEFKEAARVG